MQRLPLILGALAAVLFSVPAAVDALPFAYLPDSVGNTVTVVDTATASIVTTVPVGAGPTSVGVLPTGAFVYIGNQGEPTISVIDTATNTVAATIPIASAAGGLASDPTGTRLYAVEVAAQSLAVIDTTSNSIVGDIPLGVNGYSVAVHPSGAPVYVSSRDSDSVLLIDPVGATVTGSIPVSVDPGTMAINGDGSRLYVSTNDFTNALNVVDTAAASVIATIPGIKQPLTMAFSPDGTRLYVPSGDDGTMYVVDTGSNAVVDSHPGLGLAYSVTPSGTILGAVVLGLDFIDPNTFTGTSLLFGSFVLPYGNFLGPACSAAFCDDGDPCTDDTCDANGDCVNTDKSGYSGLACLCPPPLAHPSCVDRIGPKRLDKRFARACTKLERAKIAPKIRKQKKLLRRAAKLFNKARKSAIRGGHKGTLNDQCVIGLTGRLSGARDRARALAKSL